VRAAAAWPEGPRGIPAGEAHRGACVGAVVGDGRSFWASRTRRGAPRGMEARVRAARV